MPRSRQLLALVLAAVYTVVTTFGMSFVICVEGDGSQNVEPVGAACCSADDAVPAAATTEADAVVSMESESGDCEDCQAHLPVADVDATKVDEAQPDVASPVLLPPPALPATDAWRHAGFVRSPLRALAPQPRPPPAQVCLRTVVFLC